MKKKFWTSDWFVGLAVAILMIALSGTSFMQSAERTAYDWGVRLSDRTASDRVAVIAIDDDSLANIGRWPWSRDLHAAMIDLLRDGGAKVIGYSVFFLEPQLDPGLRYLRDIIGFYGSSGLPLVPEKIRDSAARSQASAELGELEARLFEAETALDTDRILTESLDRAGNVVLAMPFLIGNPIGNPDADLPAYVTANAMSNFVDRIGALQRGELPPSAYAAIPPIDSVGSQAMSIGHLNVLPDVDGSIRTEPLVLNYYDVLYPSFSLLLAARSLNISNEEIEVRLGESVELGRLSVTTDPALQMQTFYYADVNGRPAFSVDSFYDVFTGKIPPEKYKGKIVLIGPTAAGVGDTQVTPISPAMTPVLTLAHSVSSILNEDFFLTPDYAGWVRIGLFALIALYLTLALPRLKAGLAAVITLVLLAGLLIGHFVLMTGPGLWIPMVGSMFMLLAGHLLLTTKRFLATERGKLKSDAESAESNKMLGLSFQGQGQLDMAFDKFRRCPLDDSMMEILYNLGLDFERKRQFNKAGEVYRYMAEYNAGFRDLGERTQRTKAMEETVVLGGGGARAGTMVLEGSGMQKPKLGRYEIEKELGKGAMGVVYLGKDPKISRTVAIKTMALSQEFDADELDDVKERFFREAETAGRLNHPNIVTIYDAGEEHDLAYIAMEFLSGHDLTRYTKSNALLPLPTVLDLVTRAADALGYAHGHNVVHRDVKPANIMYEPANNEVKITDFGIARITDSSKTKTGMVLGTPSYMSPEQLSGKRVDGRSDLFSLGVMLFQLSTGQLPFTGDSMATLMFKIANEAHPDPSMLRPDLPPCLAQVIHRTLEKDADRRYQSGQEMAQDLRKCLLSVNS